MNWTISLVQGILDGPAFFQQVQDKIISDHEKAYTDDSFFSGDTQKEAVKRRSFVVKEWKRLGAATLLDVMAPPISSGKTEVIDGPRGKAAPKSLKRILTFGMLAVTEKATKGHWNTME